MRYLGVRFSILVGLTVVFVLAACSPTEMAKSLPAESPPPVVGEKPNAPTELNALAGNAIVKLSWKPAALALSYKVLRGDKTGGPYEEVAATAESTWTDSEVENGKTYFFVVQGLNPAGASANSSEASATPLTPANPGEGSQQPAAPSNLSALAASAEQINLSWADHSTKENGFKVERKTGAAGTYIVITTVGANISAYADTGLSASTEYYYRVYAYAGTLASAASNEINATTHAAATSTPLAPSGLVATEESSTQVHLAWTDNAANETGYKVERKTGSGGTYSVVATLGAGAVSYSDTGLTAATLYYYRVYAYNGIGNSANSNVVTATPGAPPDASQTVIITPAGGTFTVGSFTIVIPSGAVLADTTVLLQESSQTVQGYVLYSKVLIATPPLVLQKPAAIKIAYSGDFAAAEAFVPRLATTGYTRLGSSPQLTQVDAMVTELDEVFVADGIRYVDPVDTSCSRAALIEGRSTAPSAISLLFLPEDCQGRPISAGTAASFVVKEDGLALSSESQATIINRSPVMNYVLLVLDMSGSTAPFLADVIGGAKGFVAELRDQGLPVQIGIELFSGSSLLQQWQAPTLNLNLVLSRLDALASYSATDPATNLYGVVDQAVSRLATEKSAFLSRNYGGAIVRGNILLFTDGRDTAGYKTLAEAKAALSTSGNEVYAVGLASSDYDESAIRELTADKYITSPDRFTLEREFRALAHQLNLRAQSVRLLGYCSPKRAGSHTVSTAYNSGIISSAAEFTFDATGFAAGCTSAFFETSCDNKQCGGLACGFCDDRVAACDSTTLQCDNYCEGLCGTTITNGAGYQQACINTPTATACGGVPACRDLTTDPLNCGSCGHSCGVSTCSNGVCIPMITNFTPLPATEGVTVVINGVNFTSATSTSPRTLYLDGVSTPFTRWTTSVVEFAMPWRASASMVELMVTGDAGLMSFPRGLPMQPRISAISPLTPAPGDIVRLTGSGLLTSPEPAHMTLALGQSHTCFLGMGVVTCWGNNGSGQLGAGSNGLIPTKVSGLAPGIQAITAGSAHTCALTASGGVKCWGYNGNGQLGDGTTTTRATPADVTGLTQGVQAIAAGASYTCALTVAGGIKCWGANSMGSLGDGTATQRLVPVAVVGLSSGVQAIAADSGQTCALTTVGGVKCWGNNTYGQLGDGTTTQRLVPVDVSGLSSGVVAISAGAQHTCAVTSTGGGKCWGANTYGQLGDGTTTQRLAPVSISGLASGVQAISSGGFFNCALMTAGGIKCWGHNGNGQLGDGTTTIRYTPVDVSGLTSGGVTLDAGQYHSCAVTTLGGVKCWGENANSQLGDGTTINRPTPVAVIGLNAFAYVKTIKKDILSLQASAIAPGAYHVCATTTAGGAKCWGANGDGQLGDGTTTQRLVPVDVSGLSSGVQTVVTNVEHSCALTTIGGVKCWGYNGNGTLGDGTTIARLTPVNVSGLASGVQAIAAGLGFNCALTTAGGVKCWGYNDSGQLGDGTTIDRLTPVDVTGLTSGIQAIAAGGRHMCAVTTSGGIKCWGQNEYGKLGDGTITTRYTPVDVWGLTSGVQAIALGSQHSCALMTTGEVKCWGANFNGELGDGTSTQRTRPVSTLGLTSGVQTVTAGFRHSCALMATGGVICWGGNNDGQLGDGTKTNRLTPVEIDSRMPAPNAVVAGSSSNNTCTITAGRVKCWGANNTGQLGDGSVISSGLWVTAETLLLWDASGAYLQLPSDADGPAIVSVGIFGLLSEPYLFTIQ